MRQSLPSAGVLAACVVASVVIWPTPAISTAAPDDAPNSDQQRQQLVSRFAAAFVHDDHIGIAANSTPDITWSIPGSSQVSGQRSGPDAVATLADVFATYEVHIKVSFYAFGRNTVAVALHDTGTHDGRTLDQDVINVLIIRDGKVTHVEEHVADTSSFDAYFA